MAIGSHDDNTYHASSLKVMAGFAVQYSEISAGGSFCGETGPPLMSILLGSGCTRGAMGIAKQTVKDRMDDT